MKNALVIAGILGFLFSASAQTTIVPLGSTWKYSDKGSISGSTWRGLTYNDGTWKSGPAQLGYGDGDEATVVSYGTNASKKYITTYFRKIVSINNPSTFVNFTLGIKRDDGAVVYINGTERFRTNMPTGSISGTSKASSAAADDGNTLQTINLASSLFLNGNNIIAVEVHQFSASDPDLSFDLQLIANPAVNQPPTANAGADQSITLPLNSVSLSGSGSDPNGTISAYAWSQVSGPSTATLTNASSASATASNLVQGTYTFRLTVTDNNGATGSDDMVVTVNAAINQTPTANAGSDQSITLPINSASLSGSGSDADGTISSYAWSQVSGPSSATLTNASSASAIASNLVQGTYTFRLTVTDNNGATGTDDMVVTVNAAINQAPTANAGADQSITLPVNSASLSGSGSDADGTISTYAWSQVSGPSTATLTNGASASATASNLVQGTYTFRLTVTDNNGATGSDDMVVTVNAAINQAPTANAGADQSITLPVNSASLSGSGSDADGTISTYAWSQVSGPSTATLTNASSSSATASNLVQGTYTFRLTVTDNNGAAGSDDKVVTVNAAINQAPTANAGADQSITLPVNSASLSGSGSDADGTISTYAWSQVSGPSTATLTNASSASATASNLLQGTYTFRLTVTDNSGATASDDMIVAVNPITTNYVINFGDSWKYLDNGSNQDTAWRKSGFNDAAWASGPGQLGYGDGDEATVLGYGPSSTAKYITYYFRKTVNIVSPSSYASFTLNVKRDDGIVMYVNGTEVYRNNMPAGTVTYTTLASTAAADDGSAIQTASLSPSVFANGSNIIAVEIHQNAGSSSDISFDMELKANAPGTITLLRGPYLQMGNANAATLRWYTDVATDSKIEVGTTHGIYTASALNPTLTTQHEVRITGLLEDTKYFYRFGSSTNAIQASADNFFRTTPPAGTSRKLGIAVFGDCGRNDNSYQTGTLNAYRNYVGSNPADIMLLLGDNAYNSGTEAEYTSNFFNVYSGNILKNHMLFPAPGNHDYANTAARQADHMVPYYDIFTMPTAAECGGVASGTEAFYSYDWGNIHFLSLDSYGQETGSTRLYDTLGPQVTWIKNDLNANTKKWTVAYWHHPPYTMGSHNSDTETELINMRQNFIRILERYGVDLILCGHSHDYERSYLLKGYYGNEASFNLATHAVSSSSAKYDGSSNSCPYNTESGKVNHGTVYVVAGSAGASGSVQAGYPHNALPFALNDGGMLYLEVEDNRLDAKFIRKDGVISDKFTMMKDAAKSNTYTINAGQSVTLTASWIGSYSWSTGATTRSITVNPSSTTSYSCNDGSTACITDNFTVNVNPAPRTAVISNQSASDITVYPVPVKQGEMLTIITGSEKPAVLSLLNDKGQKVRDIRIVREGRISTAGWQSGVYFLRDAGNPKAAARKILVNY